MRERIAQVYGLLIVTKAQSPGRSATQLVKRYREVRDHTETWLPTRRSLRSGTIAAMWISPCLRGFHSYSHSSLQIEFIEAGGYGSPAEPVSHVSY
ncbi:MAG: hypothetical protein QMA93_04350 [Acidimicrobiales bacterium]|jgi:hypothetical protein